MRKFVVLLSNPEVVCVNERAYGEVFVEEVITISRKRMIYIFFEGRCRALVWAMHAVVRACFVCACFCSLRERDKKDKI